MKKTMHDIKRAEIAAGLKKAKALIDHPDKWVQYRFEAEGGRRICAFRALEKTADDNQLELYSLVIAIVGEDDVGGPERDICYLNNNSTHDELMAHFDAAIARQVSGG